MYKEDINVTELVSLIKKLYPSKKITAISPKDDGVKIFEGIADLKALSMEEFKLYERDELYDR